MSEREKSAKAIDDGAQHLALYRKYRPQQLDDIIGQPQVIEVLKSAAKSRNFAHAYLMTGQRGTGKTSAARILAHLINETPYDPNEKDSDIDIIEIDAASRGSVDDARELREKSALAPLQSSHKVYIIDEVHMLSTSAFNALLKIIEEPPEHIVFIMATTEIQKVPATILSRVQRFHMRPVSPEIVAKHLGKIAKSEEIAIDDDALLLIAERGQGSLRDSITLLDQLSNHEGKITRATTEEILGLASEKSISELIAAMQNHDVAATIKLLNGLFADGFGAGTLTEQLVKELSKLALEKPKLYNLIEKLLEVAKSVAPDLKLTAILAQAATSQKTVATAVALPKDDQKLTEIIEEKIKQENKTPKSYVSEPLNQYKSDNNSQTIAPAEINWPDILEEIKNLDQPGLLATLKFAQTEYDNGTLALYFAKAFHRKKANTANFRESVANVIEKLYGAPAAIVIASTAAPADSDVAKVLDIMGGDVVRA